MTTNSTHTNAKIDLFFFPKIQVIQKHQIKQPRENITFGIQHKHFHHIILLYCWIVPIVPSALYCSRNTMQPIYNAAIWYCTRCLWCPLFIFVFSSRLHVYMLCSAAKKGHRCHKLKLHRCHYFVFRFYTSLLS